jgi:hypothetical protein
VPVNNLSTDRSFSFAAASLARAQTETGPFGYNRPPASANYAAASQQWSFANGALTFLPSDIVENSSDLVRYSKPKSDGSIPPEWDTSLTLYNSAIASAVPQYVRAYRLVDSVRAAFGQPYVAAPVLSYGVLGVITRPTEALSGELTYALRIDGSILSPDGYAQRYDLSGSTGTATITAQGRITITLNLVGTPLGGGAAVSFGAVSSTGNVGSFEVGFDSGLARGIFFGPGGRELGAAFRTNVGSDRPTGIAIGSIVGIQQ